MCSDRLLLAMSAVILSACTSETYVPKYNLNTSNPQFTADANGWYHFPALAFRGNLRNGKPDGKGECRSAYNLEGTPGNAGEVLEAPCEYRDGLRVDELHARRMKIVAEIMKIKQEQEDARREQEEAERVAENNRQVRETERMMAGVYLQTYQNLNAATDQIAAQNRETKRLYDQAIQQKQEQARHAQIMMELEAEKAREAQELARKRQEFNEAQSRSASSDTARGRNMYGNVSPSAPSVIGTRVVGNPGGMATAQSQEAIQKQSQNQYSSAGSAGGGSYSNGARSMGTDTDGESYKYKWTEDGIAEGRTTRGNHTEQAGCERAEKQLPSTTGVDVGGTKAVLISRGACKCKEHRYPLPPHDIAEILCHIPYKVNLSSKYNPNASGPTEGAGR